MISPDYIQQGLMRRGLPAHIAQGFVMNMQDESGLNPGINEISPTVQGSRGGYGLYQLTGPRRVAYEAYAQRRGTALDDPDAQLDFLMSELQGTEKNAARSILSTQNPQDAAVAIARDFLRPSASNLEKRVNRYKGSSPMIREEPKGLLDSLGIQKMEEGAGGEAGQRFYQRDSFKDTAAVLARGFAAMGSNPALQQMTADIAEQRTENRARNKTIGFLRRSGRTDLADAVESGSLGARDAAGILFSQPKDARTSLMKNYEFYISKGMSPEDAMQAVRSGPIINMGDVGQGDYLYGTKAGLQPGYRLNIKTGEASAIPGGPAAIEAQEAAEAEARRQETLGAQAARKEAVVAGSIDTLINQIDKGGIFDLPEAGIAGNVLAYLGVNQEAVDFRNELSAVQANIAFDRLQQMREASKTGGALGAVSERELDLLINAYGNINQSTSPPRLKENLQTIKRIMTKIENDPAASNFYYGGGGSMPAPTQPSGVTVGEPY